MLFLTPDLTTEELWVLQQIGDLGKRLNSQVIESGRWVGLLRRVSFARAIQGSNSIEGYNVTLDDAIAAADNEEPLDATSETWAAITGYRDAMTYVLQLADDPHFELNGALLRSLHYMMIKYDLSKSPGKWRPGPILVRNDLTEQVVYEGPDAGTVPPLVRELMTGLQADDAKPALIRAAMAHLNLVMIHPFRDGNGRMARCLQTLVLAREGILAPQFSSIEEYLGRNTQAYYDVLAEVGGGRWQPDRDARPWIRFILTAHYRQARTLLRRAEEAEQRWGMLERTVSERKLPERSIAPLFNASMGLRVRNATYRVDTGVTELAASRDLKSLVEAELLLAHGEKRGRFYTRTTLLADIDAEVRARRPAKAMEDPFADAREALEPSLWTHRTGT